MLLRTGAGLHLDVVSGGMATSEWASVPGLVVQDKTGGRILAVLYRGWGRRPSRMTWAMCAERSRLVSAPA